MSTKDDLGSSLMEDMDAELLDFLKYKVNTFTKWDLVRFFPHNPTSTDTADIFARFTGRDADTIEMELAELAQAGVVDLHQIAGMEVYTLTAQADMRVLISRFVEACENRRFRVQAIYQVIRNMR